MILCQAQREMDGTKTNSVPAALPDIDTVWSKVCRCVQVRLPLTLYITESYRVREAVGSQVRPRLTANSANITTADAAYDGFKSTLKVILNITDGLPWSLKAAPQTFLYILQLFEVGKIYASRRAGMY